MSKPWLALGPASFFLSGRRLVWSYYDQLEAIQMRGLQEIFQSQLLPSDPKSSVSKTFAAYDNIGAES